MLNFFSWITKILRPGYVAKDNPYPPVHVESNLIVKSRPSGNRPVKPVKKSPVAKAESSGPMAAPQAKEYEGNYKDLPAFVEVSYFDWMAGKSQVNPIRDQAFEQKIVEYLDMLAESELAGSNLIPRVPSVMVQLLKRMHEENVSGSELSRIITRDVVLVAAILREVNNSFYNLNSKVTELSQAILLLGQHGAGQTVVYAGLQRPARQLHQNNGSQNLGRIAMSCAGLLFAGQTSEGRSVHGVSGRADAGRGTDGGTAGF